MDKFQLYPVYTKIPLKDYEETNKPVTETNFIIKKPCYSNFIYPTLKIS